MNATVGDRIAVHARHDGESDREGEVLEVKGAGGAPPYVVRWAGDGHVALFFPSADTVVLPSG